ncbi:MAG: hypothetical protein E4H25_07505 [Methanomassiliicoccus sp.]|nr:MAG: hypothetical protein E4H25_07505 [Methanomassiliicoccus sp.]
MRPPSVFILRGLSTSRRVSCPRTQDRRAKDKMVVLLFSGGELVCTRARRSEDVEVAVDKRTEELKSA